MCQSIAQGGRRCPAHQPATLGIKDYCKTLFGLMPEQVDHTFRKLRREGNERPKPSLAEYDHLINRMKTVTERNLSDDTAAQNRINRQLNKEVREHQLPDGATFYALKKMVARSRDQKRDLTQRIREYSQAKGISRNEAYRQFKQQYAELEGNSYSNAYGNSFDGRTDQAFELMNNNPVNTNVVADEPRISELVPSSGNPFMSYGYDPDDGRLEVTIEGIEGRYAFRNVSPQTAEQMDSNPLGTIHHLRENPFYQYDSLEEQERDAFGRWCRECHSYRAANGHVCEPTESEDTVSLVAEEVLETNSQSPEHTLEGAKARIREALRERDSDAPVIPSRPTIRMSQRRRLWTSDLSTREEINLGDDSNIRGNARGHGRYFTAPDPQEVKRLALQGKIVNVSYNRHVTSNSYARDFGTSPEVMMTHDLKFYCDDITGDVKMRRVGNPRCNCQEYSRNYNCRHIRSSDGSTTMNRYLSGDLDDYHEKVDPMARMRQEAMNGRFILLRDVRDNYDTFEGHHVNIGVPGSNVASRARRLLEDGGSVQVTPDGYVAIVDRHRVFGSLRFEGSTENIGINVINTLKCRQCNEEPCEHGQVVARYYSERILPANAVVTDSASRLQQLDTVENSDWQSNSEDVDSVLSTFSVGIDHSYTANLDKYLDDYREAREKVLRGENPLPYATENVTNGVCAPGKKSFGVEIEFDLGPNATSYSLSDIAQEMYDEGLSEYPEMHGWHYNARTDNPYSHWTIERDSTVAAEIVSPILHDTPETWENLKKICDIVKRHGGVASVNAGQHVHMGTVNREESRHTSRQGLAQKNANILHFYAANEDSIRRVQTDPQRRTHRNTSYCSPLAQENIQNSLYQFREGYVNLGSDHNSSVNFGFNDRIEFRGADASIDPAHIQAQVMLCAGVVSAAERGELPAGDDFQNLKHQRVGMNARRLAAMRLSEPSEELTDDELIVSDASFRNFITSIFDSDHGRKMMVAIAANTPWQR